MKSRLIRFSGIAIGLAIGLTLMLMLGGCESLGLFGEPKTPAPAGLNIPEGTPITLTQYQSAIKQRQAEEEAAQQAMERKALRQIAQIERSIKNQNESIVADGQAAAIEIADAVSDKAVERANMLSGLEANFTAIKADIESRRSMLQELAGVTAGVVSNSGLPGGSVIGSIIGLVAGAGGLLWGAKQSGEAKAAHAATSAHNQAWDEQDRNAKIREAEKSNNNQLATLLTLLTKRNGNNQ